VSLLNFTSSQSPPAGQTPSHCKHDLTRNTHPTQYHIRRLSEASIVSISRFFRPPSLAQAHRTQHTACIEQHAATLPRSSISQHLRHLRNLHLQHLRPGMRNSEHPGDGRLRTVDGSKRLLPPSNLQSSNIHTSYLTTDQRSTCTRALRRRHQTFASHLRKNTGIRSFYSTASTRPRHAFSSRSG